MEKQIQAREQILKPQAEFVVDKNVMVELKPEDIKLIRTALGRLPFDQVVKTIVSIEEQVIKQLEKAKLAN